MMGNRTYGEGDDERKRDRSSKDDAKPGPDPERLKLPHEDWEEAVREALEGDKHGAPPDESTCRNDEDEEPEY